MRVVVVGPTHPYKGGVTQHTTMLAHRLAAAGHDVELWSWSAQYPERLYPGQQRVVEPETPVYPRTTYPLSWRNPLGWLRTGRALRRFDAVVLCVVTPVQAPAYLVLLGAAKGVQRVGIVHNVLPHERRKVDEPLMRRLLARLDHLVVHSTAERDLAATLVDRPIEVVPLPPLAATAAQRAGSSTAPTRTLLFFGIVRPYKGLDVLLRALARTDGVRLVVAGEFWDGAVETRALIDSLGIADRVDLRPGYVDNDDVPALLAAADALVLPYRQATASAHPAIAFSHGRPVVGTTVGNLPSQVRDGVDGLLVAPEDPDALAGAITRLYEGSTLADLTAGIPTVDVEAAWADYVAATERALGSP